MNTKQMIEEEAAKLTVKILKTLNAGVPFKTMHPQKDKVQQLIEGSLSKHEAAVLENTHVCTRKGIHTCRLGAIHIPNNYFGKLPAADHLRASKSDV